MNLDSFETVLMLVSAVTWVVGIGLVLFYGPDMTLLGLALITISTIVFLLDLGDVLDRWRRSSGE